MVNTSREMIAPSKPVSAHFDPQHVLVVGLLAGSAVVAEPAALWHVDVQTLAVERSRAGLAAQEAAPYRKGGTTTRQKHQSTIEWDASEV